jgi:carbamoyl-phosphate synthase small subunit
MHPERRAGAGGPPDQHSVSHRLERRYRPPANAAVALADGWVIRGQSFGAAVDGEGEAVFTTTMVGYQEVCTDPSFRGQLVCMTYPLIGNYGVDPEQDESRQPWIAGLIVRELCEEPSHYRMQGTLRDYLRRHNIPGIKGVDTRALTRHIRAVGDTRAVLVTDAAQMSDAELVDRARNAVLPEERDAVGEVGDDRIVTVDGNGPHIVVIDCGVKRNIVRSLVRRGAKVTVVPYRTPYADIFSLRPDGVIISPGPGDPANLDDGLDVVAGLLRDETPFFGICLGHQLLARAIGAKTSKLKFGHRGGNHPVQDTETGMVTITSQNHGFQVVDETLPMAGDWRVAFRNLNDCSVEGLMHTELPFMSVQFHPEAAPGPWDNDRLFDRFFAYLDQQAGGRRVASDATGAEGS